MSIKNEARLRRARRQRRQMIERGEVRLSVHRTGQHLYAQVIDSGTGNVLAAANTLQADVRDGLKNYNNIEAATKVGKLIGERAKEKGVEQVAFDRSGYRYHGRVKALAEAAREAGLKF